MADDKGGEITFSPKKQQFKLCFAPKCAIGRSYVQVNRPSNTKMPVTAKSNNKKTRKPDNLHEFVETLTVKSPQEKYSEPRTENQVYGWYSLEIKKKDSLLHHGRGLDTMLQENLMNFAKIRSE